VPSFVIDIYPGVFLLTNIAAIFSNLTAFRIQDLDALSSETRFLGLEVSEGANVIGTETLTATLYNFHFGAILYTWFIVLHVLRTNWLFMWWTMVAVLVGVQITIRGAFSERVEPVSRQIFYVPLLVVFFITSYLTERSTLKEWMSKMMLRQERTGFF